MTKYFCEGHQEGHCLRKTEQGHTGFHRFHNLSFLHSFIFSYLFPILQSINESISKGHCVMLLVHGCLCLRKGSLFYRHGCFLVYNVTRPFPDLLDPYEGITYIPRKGGYTTNKQNLLHISL